MYINKRIIVFPGCSWLSQWLCSSLLPVWHTSQKCFWHTGNWTHIISTIQPNKLSVILSFMTHLTLHDYTEEDFKNLFPFQQDVIIGSYQKIYFLQWSWQVSSWHHFFQSIYKNILSTWQTIFYAYFHFKRKLNGNILCPWDLN